MKIRKNWVLGALILTMGLAAMDTTIMSTAIPEIVADLGGFSKFSWLFSIYLLTQTITIPIYGKLADIFGRKAILITGILIFLIGSLACAMAWDIYSLIAFRGLQGIGAGSIMATVNTIASDIYTIRERSKIQGWLDSIWGVSAIVGPALGGALAKYADWRWIFIINIPIGIVSIIFLAVFLKENITHRRHAIDYFGASLVLCTVGLLLFYLMETGVSWKLWSAPGLGIPLLIVILTSLVIRTERRAKEPILPGWFFRDKTFVLTSFALMGMGVTLMGPETFLPTFAQAALGIDIIISGFILATMSIGWPTASALSGQFYLRIGFRNTALIGSTIVIAACIGFLLIPWPQPVWLLILDQVILGMGFGLLSMPALVGVQSMVGWERRGVVTGTVIFTRNLGQSIGAAAFGAIFNHSFAYQLRALPGEIASEASEILRVLHAPDLPDSMRILLQKAVNTATHHIYYGVVFFAVLTFFFVLFMPDRGKPEESQEKYES